MKFYNVSEDKEVFILNVRIVVRNKKTLYLDKYTKKQLVDKNNIPLEYRPEEFNGFSKNVIGSYQNRREKHLKFVKDRANKASKTTEVQDMKRFFEKRETDNLLGR